MIDYIENDVSFEVETNSQGNFFDFTVRRVSLEEMVARKQQEVNA